MTPVDVQTLVWQNLWHSYRDKPNLFNHSGLLQRGFFFIVCFFLLNSAWKINYKFSELVIDEHDCTNA